MSEKSHVGMGFSVCPICGAKHDEVVLIDKRLRQSLTQHEFMGWALCPEHEAMRAEYLALVEVEGQPTGTGHEQLAKAKRTGEICHVKREAVPHIFNVEIPEDLPLIFVEQGTIAKIKEMTA